MVVPGNLLCSLPQYSCIATLPYACCEYRDADVDQLFNTLTAAH